MCAGAKYLVEKGLAEKKRLAIDSGRRVVKCELCVLNNNMFWLCFIGRHSIMCLAFYQKKDVVKIVLMVTSTCI